MTPPHPMLQALLQRRSARSRELTAPGPSPEQRALLFAAAMTAPDHGQLRPWRFLYVESEQQAALGELMAASLRRRQPDASPDACTHEASKARRVPLLVWAIARLRPGHAVPIEEQRLAAGLATHHLQLAAQSLGFASVWLSGAACRDEQFAADLGVRTGLRAGLHTQGNAPGAAALNTGPAPDEVEELLGYVLVGTPTSAPSPRPRPDWQDHVGQWTP